MGSMFGICLFIELLETKAENEDADNGRLHSSCVLTWLNSLHGDALVTWKRRSSHAGRNDAQEAAALVNWAGPCLQDLLSPL